MSNNYPAKRRRSKDLRVSKKSTKIAKKESDNTLTNSTWSGRDSITTINVNINITT